MSIQNKLEQLLDKLNNGVDFASGELPDVAKELIELEKETLLYWVYGCISVFILGVVLYTISLAAPDTDGAVVFRFIGLVLSVSSLILFPIIAWETRFKRVKLRTAPKVFILETVIRMTRRGGCE